MKPKKTLLILTNSSDPLAGRICHILTSAGFPYALIRTDRLINNAEFHFDYSHGELIVQSESIDMSALRKVWVRRPLDFSLDVFAPIHNNSAAKEELHACVLGLIAHLGSSAVVINNPSADTEAQNKLRQFITAASCGIQVPRSIVTSKVEKVKEFMSRFPNGIVCKRLRGAPINIKDGLRLIYTTKISEETDLSLLPQLPTLFQQYIPAYRNIRATVTGEDIFAVEIDTSSVPDLVDYRALGKKLYSLPHTQVTLPPDINGKIHLFMKKLGLRYASIDIIRDKEDGYWFVDLNPSGNYLWTEELSGAKITKGLLKLLVA